MFVFYSVFLTEIQHKIPQRVRFVKDAIVVLARKIPGTKKRRHWEKLQTSFCEKKKKKIEKTAEIWVMKISHVSRRVLQDLHRNFELRSPGQISNDFSGKIKYGERKKKRHKSLRKKCFCFVLFVRFFCHPKYFHSGKTRSLYKHFKIMALLFCPANWNNFERNTDIMFTCKRGKNKKPKKKTLHTSFRKNKQDINFSSPRFGHSSFSPLAQITSN